MYNFRKIVLLCIAIITALTCLIIYQLSAINSEKTKSCIVCSTTIIADAVKNIGGDSVDIQYLMGPGIDPHIYKPVEHDILKITQADIIFYNGLDLEAKMADLFKHLEQEQKTVAVSQDIPHEMLIAVNEFQEIFDPHIWFDTNLWTYAITTIYQAMIAEFPIHTELYTKNYLAYLQQIRSTQESLEKIIDTIPQDHRILITGHDAFSYFARQYALQVIGLQGISTESCPGAFDLQALVEIICQKNIPTIFIESCIPIKNIIAVQQGVSAQGKSVKIGNQLYADALGTQNSPANSYINMLLYNANTIAQGLSNNL